MCCSLRRGPDRTRSHVQYRLLHATLDPAVARGKQGHVWRLDTSGGSWAVKVTLQQTTEDEVRLATELQEAAHASGVPTPPVRRTVEGDVLATVDGVQARVYGWVDLLPPNRRLDPVLVGAAVGGIHALDRSDDGPLHPWYHEPVGRDRWDELVGRLRAEGAPFAERLAALRDEFVELESWIEPPERVRACHRDLWADNVLATRDARRRHLRHRLGQQRSGRPEPGARVRPVRVRPRRPRAGRALSPRLIGTSAARDWWSVLVTSRCSWRSSATSPNSPRATGSSRMRGAPSGRTPRRGSRKGSTTRTRESGYSPFSGSFAD